MAFKKNNPGCACCEECTAGMYDATHTSKWINDGNWTASGTNWIPDANGATLILDDSSLLAQSLFRVFGFRVTSTSSIYRFVWDWTDADNHQFVQFQFMSAPPGSSYGYVELQIGYFAGGAETIVNTYGAPPTGVPVYSDITGEEYWSVRICADGETLSVSFVSQNADHMRIAIPSGATPPTSSKSGVIAVTKTTGDYVSFGEVECGSECPLPCDSCTDGLGPAQVQVVCAGFTGNLSALNGTWIADATYWQQYSIDYPGTGIQTRGCYWLTDDETNFVVVWFASTTVWVHLTSASGFGRYYAPDAMTDPCTEPDDLPLSVDVTVGTTDDTGTVRVTAL